MHEVIDNGQTLSIHTPRAFLPLLDPRRYKGAKGGRGAAKSHFWCERLIEDSLCQHVRAACIREVQLSLEESVKQLIEDKIKAFGLDGAFRTYKGEIRGPHDSLFIFKGMQTHTAHRLKSLEGFNRCYVEEGQALSQRSLDTLTPTIRESESEMWFAWNPEEPGDPVDAFFRENEGDPDFACVHVNYHDNPWFPAELRRDMERDRKRDHDKYRHVWLGEYRKLSEAQVFKNWRVESFETPADAEFYLGADWGYSIDPTVLMRCWIDGRTLYIDREAYMVGCKIDWCPFLFGGMDDKELQEINPQAYADLKRRGMSFPGIPGARRWPITADNARPETIDYMRRHGFPQMRPSIKGRGSVEEGIEFLQSFDIVVHSRCKHTIDELTYYSYKVDPRTDEVIPVLADKKNHVIDSARYAVEKVRRKRKLVAV